MYSFIDSALSILHPSMFFLAYSLTLSLQSSLTILVRIFYVSEGALAPITVSAIVLSFLDGAGANCDDGGGSLPKLA